MNQIDNQLIHLLLPTDNEVEIIRSEIQRVINKKPHFQSAYLIAVIRRILDDHRQYGKLTIRQVYYQLVSKGIIENSKHSYQNYGHHCTTGRKAGAIPWEAFEDRARTFHKEPLPQYDINNEGDPQEALKTWFTYALNPKVSKEYDIPTWEDQPFFVEVWIEKDALAGFLSPLCKDLGVGLVVSRGYTSYTFKQEAIQRFKRIVEQDREPVLLYLGDLDPSGFDIYRCLETEIEDAQVERIGLHPDDVNQFGLVPNPIKDDDTRAPGFRERYPELGSNVYELDALPPGQLIDRVRRNVLRFFDTDIHEDNQREVRHWRANFTDQQNKIRTFLKDAGFDLDY
jgi:hypothetical protein